MSWIGEKAPFVEDSPALVKLSSSSLHAANSAGAALIQEAFDRSRFTQLNTAFVELRDQPSFLEQRLNRRIVATNLK